MSRPDLRERLLAALDYVSRGPLYPLAHLQLHAEHLYQAYHLLSHRRLILPMLALAWARRARMAQHVPPLQQPLAALWLGAPAAQPS